MSAKSSYKIPVSLARSPLDHEFPVIAGRMISIKALLFYLVAILGIVAVMMSPLKQGSWWALALLLIWMVVFVFFLGQLLPTRELRVQQVPAIVNYLPKKSRRVITRSSEKASAFNGIAGIKKVMEDGTIEWLDGGVGQAYRVVGSASVLLFDEDRNEMLSRVDTFWRTVDEKAEWIWVTTKEPQRVERQLAHLERQNVALKRKGLEDPELFDLLEEKYSILKNNVGREYASIHQYLIIKARGPEVLRQADATLRNEVYTSTLMIKEATSLDQEETLLLMRSLYADAQL